MNYLFYKLPEFNDKTAYFQFKKYIESSKQTSEEILIELKKYGIIPSHRLN